MNKRLDMNFETREKVGSFNVSTPIQIVNKKINYKPNREIKREREIGISTVNPCQIISFSHNNILILLFESRTTLNRLIT
jgi:hypothetical protein